jgi:hypothetical protein
MATEPKLWPRGAFTDREHDDVGITFPAFANAVQVWSFVQGRPTTIGEAATTFNVALEVLVEAVEAHPWMALSYLSTDAANPASWIIEHEGE